MGWSNCGWMHQLRECQGLSAMAARDQAPRHIRCDYADAIGLSCSLLANPSMLVQDSRGTDKKLMAISIDCYYNNGQRITPYRYGEAVCSNPEGYINKRAGFFQTVWCLLTILRLQ